MKTIVERAYDYADEKWGDIDEYHADTVAVSAYIAGAEERRSRSGLILKRSAIGFLKGIFSQMIVLKDFVKQWRNSYDKDKSCMQARS